VLLRPYIWESTSLLYLLPALELLAIYGLVILRFLYGPTLRISRAVVFGFLLGSIMILIIGYTVPILGAIVRYRAFISSPGHSNLRIHTLAENSSISKIKLLKNKY
jgi:hypothetical protein